MPRGRKLVEFPGQRIDPDLKEFIDECLVPALVQGALRDIAVENREIHLAQGELPVAKCARHSTP